MRRRVLYLGSQFIGVDGRLQDSGFPAVREAPEVLVHLGKTAPDSYSVCRCGCLCRQGTASKEWDIHSLDFMSSVGWGYSVATVLISE